PYPGLGTADHIPNGAHVPISSWMSSARAQLGSKAFEDDTAWSTRAIGNIHRPLFPDGIDGTAPGGLSTPIGRWSPFNVGFQLDLVYNRFLAAAIDPTDRKPCVAPEYRAATPGLFDRPNLSNGVQVFPG